MNSQAPKSHGVIQWRSQTSVSGGAQLPPFPFSALFLPPSPFNVSFLPYLPITLPPTWGLYPLIQLRAMREHCKVSKRIRTEPGRQIDSGAFSGSLKIALLLTFVLNSFWSRERL